MKKQLKLPTEVLILDTLYTIKYKKQEEMRKLSEDDNANDYVFNGLCDCFEKTIFIDIVLASKPTILNKVLRHEIVHAFLYESGLHIYVDWALNETLVDFLAIQLPKLCNICKSINIER